MLLPNPERAVIDSAKLRNYLLAIGHPVGRFKAAFFLSLGYSPERWQQLEADLRQHLELDAAPGLTNRFGHKYEIRGTLTGPNGRVVQIVSVWIILTGDSAPRLVTAYPGGQR